MTAPGAGVVSTTNAANGYKRSSGTSFAAPEAAALAAMARAIDPSLDQDGFKKLLRDTCTDLGKPGLDLAKARARAAARAAAGRVQGRGEGCVLLCRRAVGGQGRRHRRHGQGHLQPGRGLHPRAGRDVPV